MRIGAALQRPEYIFRPSQIVRRLRWGFRAASERYSTVRLPWGLPIRVERTETLGESIGRLGVYQLPVCESILRLVDPDEAAIDAGANIGLMTSIIAVAVGPNGRVISFEPHPQIFGELSLNV